ncbi:hypothetical protein ABFS82_14G077600 [Erythranthe guttata]|uniref:Germin-like protein n=1 Tax=Erythranthe guttata TaxID=4155 RepID=A0A022REG2_ERYGU|nr:PREDICTED: putative germin-like protein 2-1 [Erythranthe guttata]EYU38419.1 hypothetical protein MIMGU_mgv1a023927mg [Erythranthe guttata]|eukprot:XP_012835835.1 PREDICTED: putative germin-like protein 2-1 [Erythranthe guttata]
MAKSVIFFCIVALGFFGIVYAFDPSPLQDFCVADFTSTVRINGLPCKDPATVVADDFFFRGFDAAGNTSNPYGSSVIPMNVARVPGLNTLGLTVARLDFLPSGFIPPHLHPRGSEILTVLEGSIEVGFVTTYPNYKHYSKVLERGDAFVVPVGLVHYQRNVADGNAVVFGIVNSQNAGINVVSNAVFGAKPAICSQFLSNAFQLDKKTVEELQAKFSI